MKLRRIEMNNYTINEMMLKRGESEIKDLKRFWGDLEWYERENLLNNAIEDAESSQKPIIRSAIIPKDVKKRYETAIENLNKLKTLNEKEKPSKTSLKISKIKDKINLITQGVKNDTGPNLRMCIATVSSLSDNEQDKLDKYLGLEDIVKQGRAHSMSHVEIYARLFEELNYTSQTMFVVFSKYIGKHRRFK
jgi:hypothetical protein